MMMPLENQKQPEVDETLEKVRHVFESTKMLLESTVVEARVIENKTRYLLILTLSISFGLVGFLTVTGGNESSPSFLLELAWVGGILLVVLAVVSFVLMWILLPQYKVYHPGSPLVSFVAKNKISPKPLWQTLLAESRDHQKRTNANIKLNEQRGSRLKWSTYTVIASLAIALIRFLILLVF